MCTKQWVTHVGLVEDADKGALRSRGVQHGPRRLKAVRTLSALRTGDTVLMAGWYRGANMNPTPAASTHLATP